MTDRPGLPEALNLPDAANIPAAPDPPSPNALPQQTIQDEFPDWEITPIEIGWTATRTTRDGRHIQTVGAPTIHELRLRLRNVAARASRPRPFLDAT